MYGTCIDVLMISFAELNRSKLASEEKYDIHQASYMKTTS